MKNKYFNDHAPRNGSNPKPDYTVALAVVTMIFLCWVIFIGVSLMELENMG